MAEVVRDELVRDGIASAVITYVGAGKAQLLKETAEGVHEPLNRRVEIRIQ
jgi:outer membrane protein OmpA-like peptidoglycan-associated protein